MALVQRPRQPQCLLSHYSLKITSEQRGHLGLGQWVGNLVGAIKDATVVV